MRLAALSISAILLSGCSWLGGAGSSGQAYQYNQANQYNQNAYATGAPGHLGFNQGQNPCTIYSPVQPVPRGCDPSQVTLAGSAFNNGPASFATAGFGSHVNSAHNVAERTVHEGRKRKPKLRGSLSIGTEISIDGDLLDPDGSSFLYDPAQFVEGFVDNSDPSQLVTTTYTSAVESINASAFTFNDIHQAPLTLKAGVEYIVSPHFTVFANGGYTSASGENASVEVVGTLLRDTTVQSLDPLTGNPIGAPVTNTEFIPNQQVANFIANFNRLDQYDLELGARKYFNPILTEAGYRTLTPFVGAQVGLSRFNEVSFTAEQNQLFLEEAFENNRFEFFDVPTAGDTVTVYDDEWIFNGALTAGMEWQVTPKTAIAFETGLKLYENREFVSGSKGETNLTVPLTLRGSYNF